MAEVEDEYSTRAVALMYHLMLERVVEDMRLALTPLPRWAVPTHAEECALDVCKAERDGDALVGRPSVAPHM